MESIKFYIVSSQKLQQFEKQIESKTARLAGKLFEAGASNKIIQIKKSVSFVISEGMRKTEQVRDLFSKQTVAKLREHLSSRGQEAKSSYTTGSFLENNRAYLKLDYTEKEKISSLLEGYVSTLNELLDRKEEPKTEEKARKEIENLNRLLEQEGREFVYSSRGEVLKEALGKIQDILKQEFPEKRPDIEEEPLPPPPKDMELPLTPQEKIGRRRSVNTLAISFLRRFQNPTRSKSETLQREASSREVISGASQIKNTEDQELKDSLKDIQEIEQLFLKTFKKSSSSELETP